MQKNVAEEREGEEGAGTQRWNECVATGVQGKVEKPCKGTLGYVQAWDEKKRQRLKKREKGESQINENHKGGKGTGKRLTGGGETPDIREGVR